MRRRDRLTDGRLVLLSPFDPESRWFAHSAMDRNKLVYGLADAAVVVSSADGQGGTWAGATEALKRSKIPVYVKASGCVPSGNSHLLKLGARTLPEDALNSVDLLSKNPPVSVSLFDRQVPAQISSPNGSMDEIQSHDVKDSILATTGTVREDETEGSPLRDNATPTSFAIPTEVNNARDAYSAVVPLLLDILKEPMDEKEIAEKLGLVLTQAKMWLKRAVKDGSIRRMSKPVRYISTLKAYQVERCGLSTNASLDERPLLRNHG